MSRANRNEARYLQADKGHSVRDNKQLQLQQQRADAWNCMHEESAQVGCCGSKLAKLLSPVCSYVVETMFTAMLPQGLQTRVFAIMFEVQECTSQL